MKNLAKLLFETDMISAEALEQAEQEASRSGDKIADVLLKLNIISEEKIAETLAVRYGYSYLRLASVSFDPETIKLLTKEVLAKHTCIPIKSDEKTITLAIADPLNTEAVQDVEFIAGRRANIVVSTMTDIQDAIRQYYDCDDFLQPMVEGIVEGTDFHVISEDEKDEKDTSYDLIKKSKLTPIVKIVNLTINEGIRNRASDIHIEPTLNTIVLRNRIDGILKEIMKIPKWVQNQIVARIKILANLDITERRAPQDGRIKVRYHDRLIDLRVSTLPIHYGEKVVMRILDSSQAVLKLKDMGFSSADTKLIESSIEKPQGVILVTGPTGSGKSSTLYAFLNAIRSPKLNIVTLENPIEYELEGINQVLINEKAGLTFAGTLRSILRQDPNVIMVGEIRDGETAEIAFRASMTGHLVLSTLHTNDAPSSVTRLSDLGVEPFLAGSSLLQIIAQRLVRRNCQKCLEPYEPLPETVHKLGLGGASFEFYRGKGCDHCKNSGYSGRIGVFEVMPVNATIKELIAGRASESTIRKAALENGMTLLIDDAKAKIRSGITTAEEVLRCIHIEESLTGFCPDCNNPVDIDFSVCPYCNKSLKSACHSCGQELKPEWNKCPYCRKETEKEPVTKRKPVVEKPAAVQPQSMETPKILIVDDEDDIRKIIKFSLKRLPVPAQIMEASNGFEAIGKVEVEKPDMIILDIMMPGMDGFEVCKRLRENVTTAFIPIMMLTAKGDAESKTQGFTVGTDDYVTKPFDPEELNARVMRLLRRTYGI